MRRPRLVRAVIAGAGLLAMLCVPAIALPAHASLTGDPTSSNPLGPLVDVTAHWRDYQPVNDFCVAPTVFEFPPTTETATGALPACRASGFPADAKGLYEVRIVTPALCRHCRRLFIDYSKIEPSTQDAPSAHGHAYFRLMSFNPGYIVPPVAHSPNIKNLTNDYLVSPPGTPISTIASDTDRRDMAFAGDTFNFAHVSAQGPYYVGPWYINTAGRRVFGAYLDVDLSAASQLSQDQANLIRYAAGFDSSPSTCPDAELFGPTYTDGNYFYGGCVDAFGASNPPGVDPWGGN